MSTTAARKSRSHHARQISGAFKSHADAADLAHMLIAAAHEHPANAYLIDARDRAISLRDEMAQDIDDCIEAAALDGFGPDDFA